MAAHETLGYLEKAIDLIDMMEKEIAVLGDEVPAGKRFRLYQLLIDLRELVVAARMQVVEEMRQGY